MVTHFINVFVKKKPADKKQIEIILKDNSNESLQQIHNDGKTPIFNCINDTWYKEV